MVPGERFITEPIAFIGNNGKFTPLHYAIAALPAVSLSHRNIFANITVDDAQVVGKTGYELDLVRK